MKYPNIIGRENEISTLERLYKSKKSEFDAIYGRRRIGKSYLVSEVNLNRFLLLHQLQSSSLPFMSTNPHLPLFLTAA